MAKTLLSLLLFYSMVWTNPFGSSIPVDFICPQNASAVVVDYMDSSGNWKNMPETLSIEKVDTLGGVLGCFVEAKGLGGITHATLFHDDVMSAHFYMDRTTESPRDKAWVYTYGDEGLLKKTVRSDAGGSIETQSAWKSDTITIPVYGPDTTVIADTLITSFERFNEKVKVDTLLVSYTYSEQQKMLEQKEYTRLSDGKVVKRSDYKLLIFPQPSMIEQEYLLNDAGELVKGNKVILTYAQDQIAIETFNVDNKALLKRTIVLDEEQSVAEITEAFADDGKYISGTKVTYEVAIDPILVGKTFPKMGGFCTVTGDKLTYHGENSLDKGVCFELVSMQGRVLQYGEISRASEGISLKSIAMGVYLFRVSVNGTTVKTFVVRK